MVNTKEGKIIFFNKFKERKKITSNLRFFFSKVSPFSNNNL